jgi:hypothetical protein
MTGERLMQLAKERRSVIHPCFGRIPAAFLISMQFSGVQKYLHLTRPYRKKQKPTPRWARPVPPIGGYKLLTDKTTTTP